MAIAISDKLSIDRECSKVIKVKCYDPEVFEENHREALWFIIFEHIDESRNGISCRFEISSNPEYIRAKNLILKKFEEYYVNLGTNKISRNIYDYRV